MAERWNIGERHQSTVNFSKLIRDLRQQFPYGPFAALIVETFADSLDAKATHIDIHIDDDIYKILDNGKGMDRGDFEEYHNIASLTKTRGTGIGFAGVGAKIFLDEAEYIITETKTQDFHGATKWAFCDESLVWETTNVQNKVPYPTGTYVEVKLRSDERIIFRPTIEFVKKTLQQHYNAVLLGYYHVKQVTLNGEIVGPWQLRKDEIEKKKEFDFFLEKNRIRGFFVKSRAKLPEVFQGPSIVVHGKTVMQSWFRQYPLESDTFTGLILADYLIDILTTSKSDFEQTSKLWKKFQAKMGKVLSEWIDKIGAKPPSRPSSPPEEKLTKQLEKSINDVLKLPEFADLANSFFQNITRRDVAIKSERGGIKIGYGEQPENFLEEWIDLGGPAIIINKAHPAWKVADGLDSSARVNHVKSYHILRTVFNLLVEEIGAEEPKEMVAKLFSGWCKLKGGLT